MFGIAALGNRGGRKAGFRKRSPAARAAGGAHRELGAWGGPDRRNCGTSPQLVPARLDAGDRAQRGWSGGSGYVRLRSIGLLPRARSTDTTTWLAGSPRTAQSLRSTTTRPRRPPGRSTTRPAPRSKLQCLWLSLPKYRTMVHTSSSWTSGPN